MRKKTDTKSKDGFLSRWSDQKNRNQNPLIKTHDIDNQEESVDDDSLTDLNTSSQKSAQPEDEFPGLTDEDMPDIESLDEKSDFSGFLSPGVSDELRKLALRKLFRSKVFNVRDGLDDYDDDFRSFAALGDIITSDMKHQMELAEERKKLAEQEKLAREEQELEERSAKQDSNDREQTHADTQPHDTDDQLARQDDSAIKEKNGEKETSEINLNENQGKHSV